MALYRTGLYVKNHAVEQVQVAKSPIASFNGNVTGVYIPEIIAEIVARQAGSGTPAPDNNRPINGASECNVVRCGVNMWDEETIVASSRIQSKNYISVKPSTQYRRVTPENIYVTYFDKEKNEIGHANWGKTTFTTPADCYFIKIMVDPAYGTTYNNDISINYPATDTDYHAYNGNTYTIALGDTYYGGSLDVTNGVLTITHGYIEYDGSEDETWSYTNNGYAIAKPSDSSQTNEDKLAYSNMAVNTTQSNVPNGTLRIGAANVLTRLGTGNNDVPTFKAWLASNPLQLVYPLATPVNIQLTPTQIEQLLGVNNVWADTGDVEVKFYNVVR